MKRFKLASLFMTIAMVTSIFAGCGNKATTQTNTNTNTSKELSGTININTQAGPGAKEAWQAAADGYMALHPKVKVVVDLKPSEGYDQWLKNQFGTANSDADIVNINAAGPAATGKAINWMQYMNDKSPYSDGVWKDQFNFQLQSVDLARNEMTALSLESVQVLWCYNKDIFSKAGVEPPKTWKEFIDVCDRIQKAGYQPLAVAGDFNSFWGGQMGWLMQVYTDQTTRSMINVYRAQKGDYDYDPDVDGKFKFDAKDPFNDDPWKVDNNPVRVFKAVKDGTYKAYTPGVKTIYTNLKQVFPKYAGGNAFFGTKDAVPLFYQGKAAMLVDGAWRLAMFKNDMDKLTKGEEIKSGDNKIEGVQKFQLGTFNNPSMEGEGIEAPARSIEVALGFLGGIKKDKTHDDLVTDFMEYYSSEQGYSKYMSAGLKAGAAPAGPSLVKGVELPAEYADMFKNLKFVGNCQKGNGVLMSRGIADVQESLRDWYKSTQDYLTDKITVDDLGNQISQNVSKYFDQALKATKIAPTDLDNPQNAPTIK